MLENEAAPVADAAVAPGGAPAPAVTPAPVADPTLLGEPPAAQEPPAATPWPDDWREQLASGDDAALKLLKRLAGPDAVAKKLLEQEKTIRSGAHKKPLGDDATPEQVAEYRKALGIPDEPDGYLDKLEGLVIGDEDVPLVADFLKEMHAAHATPAHIKAAIDWHFKHVEAQAAETAEKDNAYLGEQRGMLQEAMGPDFRANINDLKAFLGQREGMLGEFMAARGANGRPLMANAAVVSWLVEQMRELNPLQTVVPGSGASAQKSLDDEIAGIEKTMKENAGAYWGDEKMQTRYRELIDARDRLSKRAG